MSWLQSSATVYKQLFVIVESPCRWQNIFVWTIVYFRQHRFSRLLWLIKRLFLGCWWGLFFILWEVGGPSYHFLLCQVVLVVMKFFINRLNSNCCYRSWNSTFEQHFHTNFLKERFPFSKFVSRDWWFFFQSPFEVNEMFCLRNKFVLFNNQRHPLK